MSGGAKGARLKIYSREVRVVGYADDWTRDQLAVSTLSCHRNDERYRSICDVPRKLQPYMPPGTQTVNGSPKKEPGCDIMLKSLLNDLGEEFLTAEMKQDPVRMHSSLTPRSLRARRRGRLER